MSTTNPKTRCKNCDTVFQGNFCPECGQNREIPRLSGPKVLRNLFSAFMDIDNEKGFFYTIIQLFKAPGTVITDYIRGKRISYVHPFKVLFALAVTFALSVGFFYNDLYSKLSTDSIIQLSNGSFNISSLYKHIEYPFIQNALTILERWYNKNIALQEILTLPLFALATRWVFRKNHFQPHFNFTEMIYMRAYISCQILVVFLLLLPFNNGDIKTISFIPSFLLCVWTYRQIYKNTWIGTAWRVLLMYCYVIAITLTLLTTAIATTWFFVHL